MKVLVANLGSTSFKYRLFELPDDPAATDAVRELARGGVERIGPTAAGSTGSRVYARLGGPCEQGASGAAEPRLIEAIENVPDHGVALKAALGQLTAPGGPLRSVGDLAAVGFKAVHGGRAGGVVRVDDGVLAAMEEMAAVAPAHNPPYVRAMRQVAEVMPGVPLVAAFETGFHATIPLRNALYAVPTEWADRHLVRRWGFHGASHRFVSERLTQLVGPGKRAISCHLGGSSSICWLKDGRSVGTSMGMSPQSGLPQNNRAGDLDPFVLLHMAKLTGRSYDDLFKELSSKSGLAGMSGTSGDMRDLESAAAAGSTAAKTAIDVFVAAVRHWIGAGLVELGGIDCLAFAGGIGENSPLTRLAITAGLQELGIVLDPLANAAEGSAERPLHAAGARVSIWVIPTNEELVVARQCRDLLSGVSDRSSTSNPSERS